MVAWLGFSPTFDQFWHVETGKIFIEEGLSPYIDHFSYTFQGEAISHQPVAFQLAYAWLTATFGLDTAGTLLKATSAVLFIVLMLWFLRQLRVDFLTSSATLSVAVLFFLSRLIPRPEIFDQVLVVLTFILADRLRHRFDTPTLIASSLLIWFWANFHAAILGYVIFAGTFIDIASRRFGEFSKVQVSSWLAWGTVLVALGFVNPSFEHPLWSALTFSDIWTSISEHQPSVEMLTQLPVLYTLWTAGFILFAWAIIIGRFGLAVTIAVFVWASIDRMRMISFTGVALACSLALLVADRQTRSIASRIPKALQVGTTVLAVFFTAGALANLNFHRSGDSTTNRHLPMDAFSYIEESQLEGNILNLYHWGGALIYNASDRLKVFIDGRTNILYDEKHYSLYNDFAAGSSVAASDIQGRYPPDYALWEHDPRAHMNISRGLGLKAEFIGEDSILYSAAGDLQALADLAMFPACVSQSPAVFTNALNVIDPSHKSQAPLANSLEQFITHLKAPQDAPTQPFVLDDEAPDWLLRLFAHWMILANDFDGASLAWLSMKNRTTLDVIYAAYSAMRSDQTDLANRFLAGALIENPFSTERPVTKQQAILIGGLVRLLEAEDALIVENRDMFKALSTKYALTDNDLADAPARDDFVSRLHCSELSINRELALTELPQ